jgi:hypothetical protein
VDAWNTTIERIAGKPFRSEAETHARDEHSAFHPIMTGLIERVGFQILKCEFQEGSITEYLGRRRGRGIKSKK